jgi:aquaporin Z
VKAIEALRAHWPEYLMEAAALGAFMVSACAFGVLLPNLLADGFERRLAGGIGMGLTAVAIMHSPWGKRSGAHINPAVTLSFWWLGKIAAWDAVFYIAAQIAGGAAGVASARLLIGRAVADVNYVVTTPGAHGSWIAFAAEFAISCLMLSTVLRVANSRRWTKATPWVAGCLVAAFITFESPLSGMSMNPARSFGSAVSAGVWRGFWVYLLAPPLAMLTAARGYRGAVFCAKYHHHNGQRCIFRCNYGALQNGQ